MAVLVDESNPVRPGAYICMACGTNTGPRLGTVLAENRNSQLLDVLKAFVCKDGILRTPDAASVTFDVLSTLSPAVAGVDVVQIAPKRRWPQPVQALPVRVYHCRTCYYQTGWRAGNHGKVHTRTRRS